ncbi:MAG: phosphate ABC transporter permease subunit PstC [Ruminococcaceae bacterium]|nr:phosphate ABC transporter permease subunit PstC [Oscillospiraceae bacterium]
MNKYKENFMRIIFSITAAISIAAVILISFFLFYRGFPGMSKIGVFNFIAGTRWRPNEGVYGIFPMILGSLYVTAGALVIGVPVGLLSAIFFAKFCPPKLYKILKPAVELLAGIPSIVYGFFGLVVIVPAVMNTFDLASGQTMLAGSLLLGIMIIPTITTVSEAAIRAVPETYYEGALALGATHEQSVFKTVVPAAKSGILAGIVLGIGRAIGETTAVLMVVGNQQRMPKGILKGLSTLTTNIVLEMGYATDLHREALLATAVVLFVFILLINLSFSVLKKGSKIK